MRALVRKNALAHEVLYFFVEHMGRTTNAVICSYKVLQELTGKSRPSVARAIRVLREDNWIETIKVGNATAYCVNARAFWQASRSQKRHAIFQATVIASETEQDSDFFEKANQKLTYIPIVEGKNDRDIIQIDDSSLLPPDQQDLDLN